MNTQFSLPKLLPRLFIGWCTAALLETLLNPAYITAQAFSNGVPLWRFFTVVLAITALFTVLAFKWNTAVLEACAVYIAAGGYLLLLGYTEHDFWFSMALVFVLFWVCLYAFQKNKLGALRPRLSQKTVYILIGIAAVLCAVYSATITVCRYKSHSTSTYDLGIFAQMFHYMKETGLPLTTCERDGLVSHFAVHISPIWYLLLPGYMLFPSPVYLQIMQSLIVVSGVIPLYLLSKQLGHSRNTTLCLCLCYCAFPALIGGQFYDIHENAFLTPLLLWMFWLYEKRKLPLFWIAVIAVLCVKEDAGIYVAAFAVYLLCSKKEYRLGLPLLLVAIAHFFAATALLDILGNGAMTATRFGAYLPPDSNSMMDVLKTVLLNPAFLFKQVFTVDKVAFLLLMLLPLALLPLCSKKISRLLLLVPLLVVNVMPDWQYQYSIHFQYVFGGIALLFYLAALNLRELSASLRRFILPTAVSFAVLLSVTHLSTYTLYIDSCQTQATRINTINQTLNTIPDEASVISHGFFVPALANRDVVYDLSTNKQAEYIVLDLREGHQSDAEEKKEFFLIQSTRYECIALHEGIIAVFRDTTYVA